MNALGSTVAGFDAARAFPNTMPDYGDLSVEDASKMEDEIRETVKVELARVQRLMEEKYEAGSVSAPSSLPRNSKPDYSIYTGAGGNAYMYWKLSEHYQRHSNKAESRRCLQLALTSIETALSLIGRLERLHVRTYVGVSFYIGDAGIYALASVVYCRANQLDKSKECLELLLSQCDKALQVEEDEVLYGRAGYLFCLLFVEKYLPGDLPTDKLRSASKGVAEVIIESGIKGSRGRKHLRYFFLESEYLGAAHGLCGILFILLHFQHLLSNAQTNLLIKESVDYLLQVRFPSGNYPAAADDDPYRDDHLVHWCHGAPGFVSLLTKAHECFGDARYKEAAIGAAQCVWDRGLLKKGISVCHGITGNAYAFLNLYRVTGEPSHRYRALKFCQVLADPAVQKQLSEFKDRSRQVRGLPDTPYSLLEGYAGVICLYVDALCPEQSAFPGYDGDI